MTTSRSSLLGLKKGIVLGGTFDAFTRLGISSDPALAFTSSETPEPPDLNLLAVMKRCNNGLENCLDNHLGIFASDFNNSSYLFY